MKRVRRSRPLNGGGESHFLAPSPNVEYVHSGCTLLDLVLGGGWALGRVVNVVGDKAVGKTLLAIEAASNFIRDHPRGRVWYCEAEAAFDEAYAGALGVPVAKIKFRRLDTIEDVAEDLEKCVEWSRSNRAPGLYVVDSLDSLSDRKAMARKIDEQGWHLEKPKMMSEMLRKVVRDLEENRIMLMIISQVRDKIGVTFGDRHSRSGGKALDFYASQIMYLSHIEQISRTYRGQKRVIGVRIRAKNKKNKVGQALRDCEFTIRFGYGVDNLRANLEWLATLKRLEDANLNKRLVDDMLASDNLEVHANWEGTTDTVVGKVWREIETGFLPKRKKYEELR